jgi:uncharacterized membrane protein YphA (DoxX/SURF4 family)
MFAQLNSLRPSAHWFLRAAYASVFLFHGFGKVAAFSGFAQMMGLSVPVAGLVTFAGPRWPASRSCSAPSSWCTGHAGVSRRRKAFRWVVWSSRLYCC